MVEVFEALYTLKDTEIFSPLFASTETTGCWNRDGDLDFRGKCSRNRAIRRDVLR